MSQSSNNARRVKPEELRMDAANHPDWISGARRLPEKGEHVLCTGGMAEVVQLLGKTGDGSRLLGLRLLEGTHPPFFVAASNVLLPPAGYTRPDHMIG